MAGFALDRLLLFAKKLQRAGTLAELLEAAREEVREATGYEHVWLLIAEQDGQDPLRLLDYSSGRRADATEAAAVLEVKGDAFLEELLASNAPLVVEDAQRDARFKRHIVEELGLRTLVAIPLGLTEKPLGVFGVGTLGDEGCRTPTDPELHYLVGMAGQIAVAASRIHFLEGRAEAERERVELERRLTQLQKLESLALLAGGIAHEFNNLLTVILSSAALAERRCSDAAVLAEFRSMLDAAGRAKDVTGQLLAMSRSQELDLRPLDLNAQLGELLQLVRRVLPDNVTVELIASPDVPLVEGDASRLDQVFMNLFMNARDAMPDGGRLTIQTEAVIVDDRYAETHAWVKPGPYALVTVRDTGVGMTREVLDRVFEPFFTTKGARAGTGLGLAVAYGIVRQHRGMLRCESEPGQGTAFRVYLAALDRPASVAPRAGTASRQRAERGAERVLVAEDDDLVRAVAVRILERAGYRVSAVEDGGAACRAVADEPFDLVLLDVVMPGMPCKTVLERLRATSPETKILLTSGYSAEENLTELARRTGFELLRKPYGPDHLLRRVRSALDAP